MKDGFVVPKVITDSCFRSMMLFIAQSSWSDLLHPSITMLHCLRNMMKKLKKAWLKWMVTMWLFLLFVHSLCHCGNVLVDLRLKCNSAILAFLDYEPWIWTPISKDTVELHVVFCVNVIFNLVGVAMVL